MVKNGGHANIWLKPFKNLQNQKADKFWAWYVASGMLAGPTKFI